MVDVVFNGVQVLHRINKDEGDESMPLLPFRKDVVNTIFLKYWADHSPAIPSDVCYDDTKYYQVQSEHRRIQNLFEHLRWSVLRTQLMAESH